MVRKKTNKSIFQSKYSPNEFVSPAQFITEYICERKAHKEKRDLPIKFWNLPEWRKYYQFQIVLCNRLLKKYSYQCILSALKDKQCINVYSLGAPWLKKVIEQHEQIRQKPIPKQVWPNLQTIEPFDHSILNEKPVPFENKKNVINILEELDE